MRGLKALATLLILSALAGSMLAANRAQAYPLLGTNLRISDSGQGQTDALDPQIAVLGQTAYAVWSDRREGIWDKIYFATSGDGGATWGANKRINTSSSEQWAIDPTIAVQPDGVIWIVWYLAATTDGSSDNDLRVARSTDGGATFQIGTLLTGDDGLDDLHDPQLAIDPATGAPYLLFHASDSLGNDQGYNLYLAAYDSQQQVWNLVRVNDQDRSGRKHSNLGFNGPLMSMAVRPGLLCVAWEDRRDRFAIYSSCSTDQGKTFSPNVAVSGADSVAPEIALAADGALYAIYSADGEYQQNMWLRRSSDQGASWGTPQQLTDLPLPLFVPYRELAVDSAGKLVLLWTRAEKAAGGNVSDLLLSVSADQGASFSHLQVEDTQGTYAEIAYHASPSMVLTPGTSADRMLLAWNDDRNVWNQIWSTRGDVPEASLNVFIPAVQQP